VRQRYGRFRRAGRRGSLVTIIRLALVRAHELCAKLHQAASPRSEPSKIREVDVLLVFAESNTAVPNPDRSDFCVIPEALHTKDESTRRDTGHPISSLRIGSAAESDSGRIRGVREQYDNICEEHVASIVANDAAEGVSHGACVFFARSGSLDMRDGRAAAREEGHKA
jgi:hypothetical protein